LESSLPKSALSYLRDGLFSGETEPAAWLVFYTPRLFRGLLVLAAYYLGTPNPGYGRILRDVWSMDSASLLTDAGWDIRRLRAVFRAGRLQAPFDGTQTIYRGVAGVDFKTACRGLSWTTSRDIACWFALRGSYGEREPIVVTAQVDASDIIYFDDERNESEVITSRIPSAQVDFDPSSWAAAAERKIVATRRADLELLAQLEARRAEGGL
jgi:hypothetical protein